MYIIPIYFMVGTVWVLVGYFAWKKFRLSCPPIRGLDDSPLMVGFILFGPFSWLLVEKR